MFINRVYWKVLLKSLKLFSQYGKKGFSGGIYFCDWFTPEKSPKFVFAIGCYEKALTGFNFLIGS